MTTLVNGPASGQHLMLKRSPFLLRVVEAGGKWDALDQLDDSPEPNAAIKLIEEQQCDTEIIRLYQELKDVPVVRWKDGVKVVLEKNGIAV